MDKMIWKLCPVDPYLDEIKELFNNTKGHKHHDNYVKWPLFEYTKFARMGWDKKLVYYSAGIERPEYYGSIRIMSRHVRDRNYDFGSYADDLQRGLTTLNTSTKYAKNLGYTDIWVSREESPKLLEYFSKHSFYDWNIIYEQLHYGGFQHVMRLK